MILVAGILLQLLAACGARSGHEPRPSTRDLPSPADGAVPLDSISDWRPADRPPDLGPLPQGWREVPVDRRGIVFDIRGTRAGHVWLAGHLPKDGVGTLWLLDAGAQTFRARPIPAPYPLTAVWGRSDADVWTVTKRTQTTDAAVWHLGATGWQPTIFEKPAALELRAIDGSSTGEIFIVGNTLNVGVAYYRSAGGKWAEQRFTDTFQWLEARDVVVAGPGKAYAVGQRSSRLRLWFFADGVWHLDQGLPGVGETIGLLGDETQRQTLYAGGSRMWTRGTADWSTTELPQAIGQIVRLRGAGQHLGLLDGSKHVWLRSGTIWKSKALPAGGEPRALWLSASWLWVASDSGRVYRHHLLTF